MKEVSLKKSAAERKAAEPTNGEYHDPETDGVAIHLEHHHLEKMGLGGELKSGDKFHMRGHGHVESSESRSGNDGERHSARLRMTHAGIEHEAAKDGREDKEGLRKELDSAFESAKTKSEHAVK
jgi:hypothetical protein